ncbi:MAG: cytochrome c oxidase assembly protein [Nocardiopsaceae bacterium]|nr:cytochrome c oxidase assembly protein [Nocardiopsaceae bacterium]
MGGSPLPPYSLAEVLTRWQFAPVVTAAVVASAGLYLWGAARVRRRHPARPWPVPRTAAFMLGLLVVVLATQSGVGVYDDTLFWDHMIQHLMLIMVAPPLLVTGQPVTLLLHASRNPVHTWTKKTLRSAPVRAITWPGFGVAAYAATIVGTHLTSFMTLVVTDATVHDAEHALYLVVGYLYFLPLIGKEPTGWKVSYPLRLFLLFIAMPVDAFTGVVLNTYGTDPFPPMAPRNWGPPPLADVHDGGAVMWIGGAGIMLVLIMCVFFGWSRETRPSGGMGWLESARRASMADRVAEAMPDAAAPDAAAREATAGTPSSARGKPGRQASLDEDDEQLAAYNAYLARIAGNAPDSKKDASLLSNSLRVCRWHVFMAAFTDRHLGNAFP